MRSGQLQNKYHDRLQSIPAPGGGGCHAAILGISNLGVMAGIRPEAIIQDLRRSIPPGSRQVLDEEITGAVNKALSDHHCGGSVTYTPAPRPRPIVRDGKIALQRIINQATINDEADLWEASPIRLMDEPPDDPALLLENLYNPGDLIFIGERNQVGIVGNTIRTTEEWITRFRTGGKTAPHIIPNPLTGTPTTKKTGDGETLRGDGNIRSYRYCIAEFDGLSREDQIRFWSAVMLPIVALIDSGGKSIHAWLDVQKLARVTTVEDWQRQIRHRLYDRLLVPLGVDGACSNPARLSRLPGHYRKEKGTSQRLLWLSPSGRQIIC